MNLPPILQSESRTRLLQGAIFGAIATVVVGFGFGGWTLGSKAQTMADQSASKAVVMALAPIDSWKQDLFVVNGGWATFPGGSEPNRNVAEACAKLLGELK